MRSCRAWTAFTQVSAWCHKPMSVCLCVATFLVPTIHSMRAGAITIEIGVGGVILAAGDGTPGCSTPVPRVSFPYAAVLWLPGSLTTF